MDKPPQNRPEIDEIRGRLLVRRQGRHQLGSDLLPVHGLIGRTRQAGIPNEVDEVVTIRAAVEEEGPRTPSTGFETGLVEVAVGAAAVTPIVDLVEGGHRRIHLRIHHSDEQDIGDAYSIGTHFQFLHTCG